MAELTGIEPAVSGVTGRHVNRYTTAPSGDPNGIRTRVASVKGWCVRPLHYGAVVIDNTVCLRMCQRREAGG